MFFFYVPVIGFVIIMDLSFGAHLEDGNVFRVCVLSSCTEELREWIAGEVQFTAYLAGWCLPLFSMLWDSILWILVNEHADMALADYCQKYVLMRINGRGFWDAEWRTCANLTLWGTEGCNGERRLARAGLTSGTLSQSIECSFSQLKKTLPPNFHNMDLAVSTQLLLDNVEASWSNRGWVNAADEIRLCDVSARVSKIHMRFVTGDAAWSERLICLGEGQLRLPSVVSLVTSAPHNFQVSDIERFALDDVVRVYTLPYQTAQMKIDEETHKCMISLLSARTLEDVELAARRIGAWIDVPGEMRCGRISISMLRSVLSSVVTVCVLSDAVGVEFDMAVRCSCGTYCWQGQCPHELFVRYLEGDDKLDVRDLHLLTRKVTADRVEKPLSAFMFKKRSTVQLPSALAWKTMADINRESQRRTALRKAKALKKDKAFMVLFHPTSEIPQQAVGVDDLPVVARKKLLERLRQDLVSDDFARMFSALSQILKANVTVAEATDSGCGRCVQRLTRDVDTSLPVLAIAQRIMQQWKASLRLQVSQSSSDLLDNSPAPALSSPRRRSVQSLHEEVRTPLSTQCVKRRRGEPRST